MVLNIISTWILSFLNILYKLFLLLNHKIAWCKVNGPIQLALRSIIIILILLKILLVLESYMSTEQENYYSWNKKKTVGKGTDITLLHYTCIIWENYWLNLSV